MKTIFFSYLFLIPCFILAGIYFFNPSTFPLNETVFSASPKQEHNYLVKATRVDDTNHDHAVKVERSHFPK
jgi:hypothetical protein